MRSACLREADLRVSIDTFNVEEAKSGRKPAPN